jgi:hypothetical protein
MHFNQIQQSNENHNSKPIVVLPTKVEDVALTKIVELAIGANVVCVLFAFSNWDVATAHNVCKNAT